MAWKNPEDAVGGPATSSAAFREETTFAFESAAGPAGHTQASSDASRPRRWQKLLRAATPEAEALLMAGASTPSRVITAISRTVSAAVFRSLYRLRAEGREHLPPSGPFLLVSNHTSFFDPFILGACLPPRLAQQVYYLGFESFFRHPLVAWWGRQVRVIPVGRGRYLSRALQTASRVLLAGKVLCLFPEGQRSPAGQLQRFSKGAGILVRELRIPVLPAAIQGAFDAWPRGQAMPRIRPLRVRFGPVMRPEHLLDGPEATDAAETVVLRLHEQILALGTPW
jgi:1-acyl-sn-glycerol-3-phosphate acyltransferase